MSQPVACLLVSPVFSLLPGLLVSSSKNKKIPLSWLILVQL